VFARTRGEVEELTERLASHGHDAAALHGGMAQDQRDRVMGRFREGGLDVLVATDVAARGLDIEHVSHVVNYDIPSNPEAYVHRIGRTGRAGREGVAITLVEPREHRLLRNIEAATRTRLELGRIPTVADLRERRLELVRGNLREVLLEDGLDRYRAVVEPLTEEFDLLDVALAAVSLAESAGRRDGEQEADIAPARFFDDDRRPERGPRPGRGPAPRGGVGERRPAPRGDGAARGRPRDGQSDGQRGGDSRGDRDGGWTRLFIGAGRRAGMRPGDLVGAITNEAGVPGSSIGAIQIAEGFSTADVRSDEAERILRALRGVAIRGRKVPVRVDRQP
jgi:ATP-dependent RNA helicase DeaD